jgi:hypothetical protein
VCCTANRQSWLSGSGPDILDMSPTLQNVMPWKGGGRSVQSHFYGLSKSQEAQVMMVLYGNSLKLWSQRIQCRSTVALERSPIWSRSRPRTCTPQPTLCRVTSSRLSTQSRCATQPNHTTHHNGAAATRRPSSIVSLSSPGDTLPHQKSLGCKQVA